MSNSVVTTGITGNTYKALFEEKILEVKPSVVGMAVAYVSLAGLDFVKKILEDGGVDKVRLVTDGTDGVTDPRALRNALDSGWEVRIVLDSRGCYGPTFHPKLYVGAAKFDDNTGVADLSLVITGSPNISKNGFQRNAECVFWGTATHSPKSTAKAWFDCWNHGTQVTLKNLPDYEKHFAECNRYRQPKDIVTLGIADSIPKTADGVPKKGMTSPRPEYQAISQTVASVVWVGLQSFTGAYNLQVQFPKEAGLVLRRIFENLSQGESIDMLCADDEIRTFKYRFYPHNGMFRLNIPNSTPSVKWVRQNKQGIAYVEYGEKQGVLSFKILRPNQLMIEIVERSFALGTWGRTPKRLYGWY